MNKNSRQNLKYLENEKSFWDKIKNIYHNFKGPSVAKNFLRPESAPLTSKIWESFPNYLKKKTSVPVFKNQDADN